MRWLARLSGDSERHIVDLPDNAGDNPGVREAHTTCGRYGQVHPERLLGEITRDELTAAALGVCPRCLSR